MQHAFRDRPLSATEFEVLRLVLSTFRDGSGQHPKAANGQSMPDYRNFERSLASVLQGATPENKGIFDVVVTTDTKPFGISCKMSSEQPKANKSSFMELSNSSALFRAHLLGQQINWVTEPMLAGPAIIDLVTSWHRAAGTDLGIDVASSKYAILSHDNKWKYFQVLAFPLSLKIANPKGDVEWLVEGKALNGYIDDDGRRHRLWQFYQNSGGQLKYYPLLKWADYVSPAFQLEKPELGSLIKRAHTYFSDIWPKDWPVNP